MQDATPITLGQEWSGYVGMLADNLKRMGAALQDVYSLALGGTAVGTGINAAPGFADAAAAEIASLSGLPFVSAPNKFTVQGAHDALVQLSGTLRTLAVSLYKIGKMNVYKPLMIFNLTHSITIMTDGCTNFRRFLVEGTKPNRKKIQEYVDRSLMLVTALAPVIGYDKASKIAHHAMDHDLTLKAAALQLGFVTEAEFDRIVDPAKMVRPYVAQEH
jgi:fumarate hydratase class II